MSFISRQDTIFRRLIDRFDLKRLKREYVTVPSLILPVTNVDELLNTLQPISEDSTTATVALVHNVVPEGKKWTIIGYYVTRDNAGGLSVMLYDRDSVSAIIKVHASAEEHYGWLEFPLEIDAGWSFSLYSTSGVSGAITTRLVYRETDAF